MLVDVGFSWSYLQDGDERERIECRACVLELTLKQDNNQYWYASHFYVQLDFNWRRDLWGGKLGVHKLD